MREVIWIPRCKKGRADCLGWRENLPQTTLNPSAENGDGFLFTKNQKFYKKVLASPKVKQELFRIFESICKWKHWEIIELSIQDDHIHFCILITPKESVSYTMQILKGKSSAWLKKKIRKAHGLYERHSLWAKGYFVSTIGIDEAIIKRYVRHQHHHNKLEQPSLFEKL